MERNSRIEEKAISSLARLEHITPDAEARIVAIARVSSTGPARRSDADLLRYLIRESHWSPLEMVSLCIETPRIARSDARQLLRHPLRVQEFSQRYAKVPDEPIHSEARMQDPANRQNSLPCDDPDLRRWWRDAQFTVWGLTHDLYEAALDRGIAKEQARRLLPEGMAPSRCYWSGDVRSHLFTWHNRRHPAVQQETREVADAAWEILREHLPVTVAAFTEAMGAPQDAETPSRHPTPPETPETRSGGRSGAPRGNQEDRRHG